MGKNKVKKNAYKTNLVFDEQERVQYLTGFQKRKAERRIRAKEKLEKQLKEEKKKMKERQKDRIKRLYENQRTVPEVEHLLEPSVTYELPQHLVSITSIDTNHIAGTLGLTLGLNKTTENHNNNDHHTNDEKNESGTDKDSNQSFDESENETNLPQTILKVKKSLRKQRLKDIKSSKAFQTQEKLKHKKDLNKAKLRKKMIKKEMKHSKIKSKNKKSHKKTKKGFDKNRKFDRK